VNIAILPGDGIGPEIVAEAVRVLDVLDLPYDSESALVGGAAYTAHGHPLPDATLKLAQDADAVLFGAVGDWKYDTLERALRPEQAILGLRKHLRDRAGLRRPDFQRVMLDPTRAREILRELALRDRHALAVAVEQDGLKGHGPRF
jgi:isocitrate/isopropylmalate dehydrogenase